MTPENKEIFKKFSIEQKPNEACALLVLKDGVESLFICDNIAKNKTNSFILCPKSFALADNVGQVIGVVHSHPNGRPDPSEADRVACEAHGLPWHIYSVPLDTWCSFNPEGYVPPLVGRPFHFGVLDCFSLVRDYYKQVLNIEIKDFHRSDEDIFKTRSLYEENMEEANFKKVENLEKHDVILMQIGHRVPCHAAIYLGDDLILHHLRGCLSKRDVYGGIYKRTTRFFCRYFGDNK